MRKKKYSLSKQAISDLEEIWLYTFETWSGDQADRYYILIIDEINNICKNYKLGKSMEHIRKGYRASIVKSHLIFYRLDDEDNIEIIRILHQQMDIENRLID